LGLRVKGLLLALTKSKFFSIVATMIGGLMVVTLLLAFLYIIYGRERKRT